MEAHMNKHLLILAVVASLTSGAAFAGKVDVNTAESLVIAKELGISDVIAARIVAEREENGRFRSPEDLASRVKGLSPQFIAKNKSNIAVSDS
jgi:DNA uptake protein ComE-like DNA-binding protein